MPCKEASYGRIHTFFRQEEEFECLSEGDRLSTCLFDLYAPSAMQGTLHRWHAFPVLVERKDELSR